MRERVPLAGFTTLGVGGDARFYVEATREADVHSALTWARSASLPVVVLGGGSNVLVADEGLDGLVLRVRIRDMRIAEGGASVEVDVGAGLAWDDLVAMAVERGWSGLECLSGIPGDVGATPIQNVGAYGQDVSSTIELVRTIERSTLTETSFDREACRFGYRDSIFKQEQRDRHVIVRVSFRLRTGDPEPVRYPELARVLGSETPSTQEIRRGVLSLRRTKSMVLDPLDENGRSAGSFFMNPIVDAGGLVRARAEADRFTAIGERMPEFPAGEGRTKLSAAWLIERAGFAKGFGSGPVGISTRHTLAIVNRGGARASDIVDFARRVRDGVEASFGVRLRPEPVLLGFSRQAIADFVDDGDALPDAALHR